GIPGHIDTHPKAIRSEEHTARIAFEPLEHFGARQAPSLEEKIEIAIGKKLAHPLSEVLHGAIVGKQNESVTVSLSNEVLDPPDHGFFITGLARVRHFADDEYFHLPLEIEWAAQPQGLDCLRPNAISEIGEVFSSNAQGGAGHDTSAAGTE